ncbi:MAG TPA: hypothetical protein VE961_07965 [Pyrinomonadaceae bacterium]|nr:hypothetical protein [Pyrinomonadaceae bacterium]
MKLKNRSGRKNLWRLHATGFGVLALVVSLTDLVRTTQGGAVTPQQDTEVGATSDSCSPARVVRFQGQGGEVLVKPGETKRVTMPAPMNEFHWFCGDSRERVANDDFFNVVRISRAHDGAISWKFYKSAPQPEPGSGNNKPDLVKVGDTKDACDGERDVRFKTKSDPNFKIGANQSKLVQLAASMNTLDWWCVQTNGACPEHDVCDEHLGNPVAFNWVQVDRAGNGAISWVFYRQKSDATPVAPDVPPTPQYVHNATGDLRVMASLPGINREAPFDKAFLKNKLDDFWKSKQGTIRTQIKDEINSRGSDAAGKFGASFQQDSLTISDTERNELRTAAKDGTLWVKYVAHHNVVNCRLLKGALEIKFTISFDIQLEMAFPQVALDQPPQTPKAPMRLAHTEVEGDNFFGDVAQEIFKSKFEEVKTEGNNYSENRAKDINEHLKTDWPTLPQLPKNGLKTELSVSPAGTVRFCLRAASAPECDFGPMETAHTPGVMDTTGGGCDEGLLWIRDAETRKFTSIAKGKDALIEVESRRFNWYCGGNQGPESQEWESGPVGTYFAQVSRNSNGRGITFKFLAWR